eukprot:113940_1
MLLTIILQLMYIITVGSAASMARDEQGEVLSPDLRAGGKVRRAASYSEATLRQPPPQTPPDLRAGRTARRAASDSGGARRQPPQTPPGLRASDSGAARRQPPQTPPGLRASDSGAARRQPPQTPPGLRASDSGAARRQPPQTPPGLRAGRDASPAAQEGTAAVARPQANWGFRQRLHYLFRPGIAALPPKTRRSSETRDGKGEVLSLEQQQALERTEIMGKQETDHGTQETDHGNQETEH